jgi:hypothetical protein
MPNPNESLPPEWIRQLMGEASKPGLFASLVLEAAPPLTTDRVLRLKRRDVGTYESEPTEVARTEVVYRRELVPIEPLDPPLTDAEREAAERYVLDQLAYQARVTEATILLAPWARARLALAERIHGGRLAYDSPELFNVVAEISAAVLALASDPPPLDRLTMQVAERLDFHFTPRYDATLASSRPSFEHPRLGGASVYDLGSI